MRLTVSHPRRLRTLAAAGLMTAAFALGACSTTNGDGEMPLTPISRFSLQVEPGLDRIALAVHDSGLSARQEAALQDLAARHRAEGAGVIVVQAPSGNDPAASGAAWAARASLEAAGVPAHLIQVAAYDAPDPRAPVLAGFEVLRARVPDCSREQGPREGRFSNQSSLGLGCAVNANLAAQITNPRDIVQPRDMPPAETGRAATVFTNYRQGNQTSSAQEALVEGRISRAVD
jgi:pilus assembly protein CpaD